MYECIESQDDGLIMRPSGAWVLKKLDYLQRYIDTFVTSMRNKPWRAMNYIDLFSGPGKCCIREIHEICLGSCLIALNAKYPFSDYYFVDSDPDNIAALRGRCAASALSTRIHYFVGDSNQLVDKIVADIAQLDQVFIHGHWPSLNLAFLDPAGLDLHWTTVEKLAQINRMDLVIHYPQMGLTRSMPTAVNAPPDNKVDLFFGGSEWRSIYGAASHNSGVHRHLIDHYRKKLLSLGYADIVMDEEPEPLIRNTVRSAPLYRLIFASKHSLGHDFWRQVTSRDVFGQSRLF